MQTAHTLKPRARKIHLAEVWLGRKAGLEGEEGIAEGIRRRRERLRKRGRQGREGNRERDGRERTS